MKDTSRSRQQDLGRALAFEPFATPELQRRRALLEANLRSPAFSSRTAQAIRTSKPRGKHELQTDGTPWLRHGKLRLGVPLASHSDVASGLTDLSLTAVVVVFGGAGGQLPRLVRMLTGATVVVFEPDAGLLRTVLEAGPASLSDLHVVTDVEQLARVWRSFRGRYSEARVLPTRGYTDAFPGHYDQLQAALRMLTRQAAISGATHCGRSRAWVRHILRNAEVVQTSPPFARLAGMFRNVPAFIVGAGPSLDKNVEHLREAARKGILFATNSGALALAKHDIEPQVVVCIESMDASERLKSLPFLDRCVRAFSLSAAPRTLRTGKGPLLHCHEAIPQYDHALRDLTHVRGILTSGCVSTTATSLARLLGCSPIVMVGQDLAYTDGSTYAAGTGYESSQARVDEESGIIELTWNEQIQKLHAISQSTRGTVEDLVRVEAWGGSGEVTSTHGFVAIRQWFEELASLTEQVGAPIEFINATEGGSQIAGFREERLQALLERLPDRAITAEQMAQCAHDGFEGVGLGKLCNWLSTQRAGAREVRRHARRCARINRFCHALLKRGKHDSMRSAYAKLESVEAALQASVQEHSLVEAWAHAEVYQAANESLTYEVDSEKSALNALARGVRLATVVERASQTLIEEISNILQRLEAGARQGVQACPYP